MTLMLANVDAAAAAEPARNWPRVGLQKDVFMGSFAYARESSVPEDAGRCFLLAGPGRCETRFRYAEEGDSLLKSEHFSMTNVARAYLFFSRWTAPAKGTRASSLE